MLKIRYFLIISLFLLSYTTHSFADEITSPQISQIQPKQQTESTIKKENQPTHTKKDSPYPSTSEKVEDTINQQKVCDCIKNKGTNQGTEFCVFYDYRFKISDLLLVVFTAFLVLFTAVLAGVAIWQGSQLKKQVIALKDSERAHIYVFVRRHPEMEQVGNIEEGLSQARITVMNFGRTPAVIIKINYELGLFANTGIDNNLSEMITKPSQIPPKIIVVTNDKEWGHTVSCDISAQDADNIGISSQFIYACFGRIDYRDVFGTIYKMTFCWEDNGIFFIPDEKRCKHI
jgi:hypothetical protein